MFLLDCKFASAGVFLILLLIEEKVKLLQLRSRSFPGSYFVGKWIPRDKEWRLWLG